MSGTKTITCLPSLFIPKLTIKTFSARKFICVWSILVSLRKRLLGTSTSVTTKHRWHRLRALGLGQAVVEAVLWSCPQVSHGVSWGPGDSTSQSSSLGGFSPGMGWGDCMQHIKSAKRKRNNHLTVWSAGAQSSSQPEMGQQEASPCQSHSCSQTAVPHWNESRFSAWMIPV